MNIFSYNYETATYPYNPDNSTTYQNATEYKLPVVVSSTIDPGNPIVTYGKFLNDTFCVDSEINNTTCIEDFSFFWAFYGENWGIFDGILGLGREIDDSSPPSIARAMKNAGLIDKAEASVWLNNIQQDISYNTTSSEITFGGDPDGKVTDKFIKHAVASTYIGYGNGLWTLPLQEWKVSGVEQKTNTKYAIIEPAWFMAVPEDDW